MDSYELAEAMFNYAGVAFILSGLTLLILSDRLPDWGQVSLGVCAIISIIILVASSGLSVLTREEHAQNFVVSHIADTYNISESFVNMSNTICTDHGLLQCNTWTANFRLSGSNLQGTIVYSTNEATIIYIFPPD